MSSRSFKCKFPLDSQTLHRTWITTGLLSPFNLSPYVSPVEYSFEIGIFSNHVRTSAIAPREKYNSARARTLSTVHFSPAIQSIAMIHLKIPRMISAGFSSNPNAVYAAIYTDRFRNGGEVRTCLACDIREIRLPRGLYASTNCRPARGWREEGGGAPLKSKISHFSFLLPA